MLWPLKCNSLEHPFGKSSPPILSQKELVSTWIRAISDFPCPPLIQEPHGALLQWKFNKELSFLTTVSTHCVLGLPHMHHIMHSLYIINNNFFNCLLGDSLVVTTRHAKESISLPYEMFSFCMFIAVSFKCFSIDYLNIGWCSFLSILLMTDRSHYFICKRIQICESYEKQALLRESSILLCC